MTNTAFVTACFNNILGRAPDPAGLSFFEGQLSSGVPRGDVMASLAESGESQARINPLISTWQTQAGQGSGVYTGSFF